MQSRLAVVAAAMLLFAPASFAQSGLSSQPAPVDHNANPSAKNAPSGMPTSGSTAAPRTRMAPTDQTGSVKGEKSGTNSATSTQQERVGTTK